MIYRRRKDTEHDAVRDALRAAGWYVVETYQHPGLLDMLIARDRLVIWVETKSPRGRLTIAEQRLIESWPGHVIIAYSPHDAVEQAQRIWREWQAARVESVGVIHP